MGFILVGCGFHVGLLFGSCGFHVGCCGFAVGLLGGAGAVIWARWVVLVGVCGLVWVCSRVHVGGLSV